MTLEEQSLNRVHQAIDPGSNKMGIAIFDTEGRFIVSKTFRAPASYSAAQRLHSIRKQYLKWFSDNFPNTIITKQIMEHLPPNQFTLTLQISPGAVVATKFNRARLQPQDCIPVETWKKTAKELGSKKHNPKGVAILEDIGWEYKMPLLEDEADAIVMYLSYQWVNNKKCWLGPTKKARNTIDEKRAERTKILQERLRAKKAAKRVSKLGRGRSTSK